MVKLKVRNDLRLKSYESKFPGTGTLRKGKLVHCISGVSTRLHYDASLKHRYKISGSRMDKLVTLTHLAIGLYNIREGTNFSQVKVLKVVVTLTGLIDNRITFQAQDPLGVTRLFKTKISEHFFTIQMRAVRLKRFQPNPPSDDIPKLDSAKSLKDLVPYFARCALNMYNVFTLHVKKDLLHDIASLKVVKAVRRDAEQGTTYLVTFEASLCDDTKNVETFETQILLPTLFPITTMEFKEIKMIKQTGIACRVCCRERKLVAE